MASLLFLTSSKESRKNALNARRECHRQEKLVPSARNKPMHNARKVRKIKTLRECLLMEKDVKLQKKNDTRLSNDERKDKGLYNELKAWKPASGS